MIELLLALISALGSSAIVCYLVLDIRSYIKGLNSVKASYTATVEDICGIVSCDECPYISSCVE